MRRFHFGALSSFKSLADGRMMGPCAEMEAPYANSLLRPAIVCQLILYLKSKSCILFHESSLMRQPTAHASAQYGARSLRLLILPMVLRPRSATQSKVLGHL